MTCMPRTFRVFIRIGDYEGLLRLAIRGNCLLTRCLFLWPVYFVLRFLCAFVFATYGPFMFEVTRPYFAYVRDVCMILRGFIRFIRMGIHRGQACCTSLQDSSVNVFMLPLLRMTYFRRFACRSRRAFIVSSFNGSFGWGVVISIIGRSLSISLSGPAYSHASLLWKDRDHVATATQSRPVQAIFGVTFMGEFGGRPRGFLCGFILGNESTRQALLSVLFKGMGSIYEAQAMALILRPFGSDVGILCTRSICNLPIHTFHTITYVLQRLLVNGYMRIFVRRRSMGPFGLMVEVLTIPDRAIWCVY